MESDSEDDLLDEDEEYDSAEEGNNSIDEEYLMKRTKIKENTHKNISSYEREFFRIIVIERTKKSSFLLNLNLNFP